MDGDSAHEPLRLTSDDPFAGLADWLAEGRVDAAARERARQWWLERQADEDASVAGVLFDLAERQRPIAVRTRAGRTRRGPVVALGADFAIVREGRLGDVVIPFASVATVRPAPGDDPAVGDRTLPFPLTLAGALVELAADRPLVLVVVAGDEFRGELRRAGVDVVGLATAAPSRELVHIAIDAIDHLVLLAR